MLLCLAGVVFTGCNDPGTIDLDFTGQPVRFFIHHRGWPRPFHWPRVTEFAIASEEDGAIWQLRSEDSEGQPARELAIIYGRLPPGFVQEFPAGSTAPVPLQRGRTYYVAAGGPRAVYRMVFALPITALEHEHPRPTTTTSAPAR